MSALGASFLAGMAMPVLADSNPFSVSPLSSGYDLVNRAKIAEEGKCGGKPDSTADMKKCAEEGKCGEGKCGDEKKCEHKKEKLEEAKAAADKADEEGKCGEGMCGGM